MRLTTLELKNFFLQIIQKKKSFEEASNWASEMIEMDEQGQLEVSRNDITKIFSGLTFLSGLDIEESAGKYLHSIENVINKYNELFSEG